MGLPPGLEENQSIAAEAGVLEREDVSLVNQLRQDEARMSCPGQLRACCGGFEQRRFCIRRGGGGTVANGDVTAA